MSDPTAPDLLEPVDVLLLDMDGTLVDSGEAVVRSWNALFAELGSDRTFTTELHGTPACQVIETALPDLSAEERARAAARIEEIESSDTEGILVLPGTERVLSELDAAAHELGRPTWTIVTSCTRRLFDARWAVTGLTVPEGIVTADQVSRGKPDPEPYLLGMERLRAPGSRSLVVEDSVGGLRAGRAAGAQTLAVTTTASRVELAGAADALVGTLEDIVVDVREGRLVVRRRA